MKIINCWQDLEPYGIVPLTGEACGMNYRLLCDVTEKGRKILGKLFGAPQLQLSEAWNGGSKDDPHVASIMLCYDFFAPVGVFALLESGCSEVWLYENQSVIGFEPNDSKAKMVTDEVVRTFRYGGTAGDRNVHLMTGRTQ